MTPGGNETPAGGGGGGDTYRAPSAGVGSQWPPTSTLGADERLGALPLRKARLRGRGLEQKQVGELLLCLSKGPWWQQSPAGPDTPSVLPQERRGLGLCPTPAPWVVGMVGGPWDGAHWETCQGSPRKKPCWHLPAPATGPRTPACMKGPFMAAHRGSPESPLTSVRPRPLAQWGPCPLASSRRQGGVWGQASRGQQRSPASRLAADLPGTGGGTLPCACHHPHSASPGRGHDGRGAVPKPAHGAPGPSRGGAAQQPPSPPGPRSTGCRVPGRTAHLSARAAWPWAARLR